MGASYANIPHTHIVPTVLMWSCQIYLLVAAQWTTDTVCVCVFSREDTRITRQRVLLCSKVDLDFTYNMTFEELSGDFSQER